MFAKGFKIQSKFYPVLLVLCLIAACLVPNSVMATVSKPAVNTGNYYSDGDNIVLEGLITSDGLGSISEYGFYYARSSDISDSNPELMVIDPDVIKKQAGTRIAQGQQFSAILTGLQQNQVYSYFAYVTNEQGTAYGSVKQFTAADKGYTLRVKTLRSSVSRNNVILYGEITEDGNQEIIEYGFYYGTNAECEHRFQVGTNDIGERTFKGYLTGLRNDTGYYYRAYARNASGLAYGSIMRFTTEYYYDDYDNYYSYGRPVVSTQKPVNQSDGTLLYGYISSQGSSPITSYGFYWGNDSSPDNEVEVGSHLTSGQTFSYVLDGLIPGETYYVQAYARNSHGTSRGSVIRFSGSYSSGLDFNTRIEYIGASRAIFRGWIGSVSSSRVREYGFVYGQVYGLETMVKVGTTPKKNSEYVYYTSGLERGCLYYVRSYVITAAGTTLGPEVRFIAY